jgi:hypothetical protein
VTPGELPGDDRAQDVARRVGVFGEAQMDVDHEERPAAAGVEPLAHRGHERRRAAVRQDQAVGHAKGRVDRARARGADQDRRSDLRRLIEGDVVVPHVAAVTGHALTGEELAHGGGHLLERRQRRLDGRADLRHPGTDSVADPHPQAPGMGSGQGGDVHRRERGRPGHRGQDAQADRQRLRGAQREGSAGDAAGKREVVDHPGLVEPALLGSARPGPDLRGRRAAVDQEPQGGHAQAARAPA